VRRLEARKLAQLTLIDPRALLQNKRSVRRLAPAFMRESNDHHAPRMHHKRLTIRGSAWGQNLWSTVC